ncbi:MAG: diaminopropionate ammonia-lyase [Alphaproteobacteria bacterium]
MKQILRPFSIGQVHNPNAAPETPYGPALEAILNAEGFESARREISGWPGYAPTPLHRLSGLAEAAGVAEIWYKDEGGRFGLGSFKALGGAYAVSRVLAREVAARSGQGPVSAADLRAGRHRDLVAGLTVCAATDGNHGRSVSWGAQMFGSRCVIYIPDAVSPGRQRAMEGYGAEVRRIDGTFDDAVRRADADAATEGWFVVADTTYPGYTEIPRDVMHGYGVMAAEVIAQIPEGTAPSHVFVQGGVGGLAAAVCARLWQHYGIARPRYAVVEPEAAACFFASARAGRPVVVEGDLETVMGGLAAGACSMLAWELLWAGADDFLTLPDAAALEVMRLLSRGTAGDPTVVAGESAVAGLAGALGALQHPETAVALGLGPRSRVLVFGTEGATDPKLYQEIVGRTPEVVAAGG